MIVPNSIAWDETQRGGIRRLRLGEIVLAQTLYQNSIRYNQVWVHRESYLPFDLQDNLTAMTPNGEMWFQEGVYQHDFSVPYVDGMHLFLHEMMHVWQHQHGVWVRTKGAFSWAVDYTYSFDKQNLFNYGMEQQASIVSDYWLLKHYGFDNHRNLYKLRDYNSKVSAYEWLKLYESIIGDFPG